MCSKKKKNPELEPKPDELIKAAIEGDGLSYVAHIAASYVLTWDGKAVPSSEDDRRLHNALLEVSLLFIRKTTEFFKPKDHRPEREDDLKARLYLKNWSAKWVIEDTHYDMLHKAVGHMTIRGVRCGQIDWDIQNWTVRVVEEWQRFYEQLPESHVFNGIPPRDEIDRLRNALGEIAERCRAAVIVS